LFESEDALYCYSLGCIPSPHEAIWVPAERGNDWCDQEPEYASEAFILTNLTEGIDDKHILHFINVTGIVRSKTGKRLNPEMNLLT
jgi:hypothetical protein